MKEKKLYLFTYVDGVNDIPFPNATEQGEIYTFDFEADRMGGAPSISAELKHRLCLDNLWSDNVYVSFDGEKYFVLNTPSSSKDNQDERYKHEVVFLSERELLNHVYFIDAVQDDSSVDVYKSNSTKVNFMGDINEFASRLDSSLKYANLDYSVVVDEGVQSGEYFVSFEDKYILQALQEMFTIYNIPYYFVGKVIHIGFTENTITTPLKYGNTEALLSIEKNNANYQIINRITGTGSSDNIPYYYPNETDNREEIVAGGGQWITPMTTLMPSIYRESLGAERFYNAQNDTYKNELGEFYEFENVYTPNSAREGKVAFEDIKPSIEGIENAQGERIDMFLEFAYDTNDNDDTDEEGNYIHPYFFAKLRKFDGDFGFNLFAQASATSTAQVSMTSGVCGACSFEIGVGENSQKNTVQVDSSGNLLRDADGNVRCGREGLPTETPQDRQQDTTQYEVWIALKKDNNTYGQLMPNATQNLKPSTTDTFVFLGIEMPDAYIKAAEKKLDDAIIKHMWQNNVEKFTFSIKFSRIFFAENPDILALLDENSRVIVEYNGIQHALYIDNYVYKMDGSSPLPEISVNLVDTLSIGQNSLQNALDSVKQDILSSIGSVDVLKQGLRYFLRKDIEDVAQEKIVFSKGIEIGSYTHGTLGSGAAISVDPTTNATTAEVDFLEVRRKAIFNTLTVKVVEGIGGELVVSPAAMVCSSVEEMDDSFRCYFNTQDSDGRTIVNEFKADDQARMQMFNLADGGRYYWRLVLRVGDNYIDLSKTDADANSDVPLAGDNIVQLGNRSDVTRQSAHIVSTYGSDAPSYKILNGINSFDLTDKVVSGFTYDYTNNEPIFFNYGSMFLGDKNLEDAESTYVTFQKKAGDTKKKVYIKGTINLSADSSGLTNLTEWAGAQEQINNAEINAENALQEVNNIEVGGVNLLLGSRDYTGDGFVYIYKDDTTYNDCSVSKREFPAESTSLYYEHVQYGGFMAKANTYYTLSFWAKSSVDGAEIRSYLYNVSDSTCSNSYNSSGHSGTSGDGSSIHTLSTEWKRYWTVFKTKPTIDESLTREIYVARNLVKGTTTYIAGVKFEIGNKATDWSPNPLDLEQSITDLQDYVDGAFSDGIITLTEAKSIKELAASDKASIDEQYNVTYNNPKISNTNQSNLASKYNTTYVVRYNALITACDDIINADTITTELQTALATAYANYTTSRTELLEQLKTCSQQINFDTSSSLAAAVAQANVAFALTEGLTAIEGGLVLTNMIKLLDANNEETGGLCGTKEDGNNVGAWFGGTFEDALNNLAKIIFRFNGTAKIGNYEINKNGDFIAYDGLESSPTYGNPMVLITKSTVDRNTVVEKQNPSTTEILSQECGLFSVGGASATTTTTYSAESITITTDKTGGRAAVIGLTLTADASANYNASATITASLVLGTLLLCEIGTVTAAGGTIKQQSFTVGTETDSSGAAIGSGDLRVQFTYSYTNGGVSTSTYKLSYSKTTEGSVITMKPQVAIGQNGIIVGTTNGTNYRYTTAYQGTFSDFIKIGDCGLQHTSTGMMRMLDGTNWKLMPEIILMGTFTRDASTNEVLSALKYNPMRVSCGATRSATGKYSLTYGNLGSTNLTILFTDVKKDASSAAYAMATSLTNLQCDFITQDDDSVNDIISLTFIIIKHFNDA